MKQIRAYFIIFLTAGISFIQCKQKTDKAPEKDIVSNPAQLEESTTEDIHNTLEFLKTHDGRLNDSVHINFLNLIDSLYDTRQYKPIWLRQERTIPEGTSFINLIQN